MLYVHTCIYMTTIVRLMAHVLRVQEGSLALFRALVIPAKGEKRVNDSLTRSRLHSLCRRCSLSLFLSEKENVLALFRTSIRLRPHNRAPLCDYASPQPCRLLSILIVVERVSDQDRVRPRRGPENCAFIT